MSIMLKNFTAGTTIDLLCFKDCSIFTSNDITVNMRYIPDQDNEYAVINSC